MNASGQGQADLHEPVRKQLKIFAVIRLAGLIPNRPVTDGAMLTCASVDVMHAIWNMCWVHNVHDWASQGVMQCYIVRVRFDNASAASEGYIACLSCSQRLTCNLRHGVYIVR